MLSRQVPLPLLRHSVSFSNEQIADKLCSAFGQDILDTLFSKETLEAAWWSEPSEHSKQKRRRKRERATPFFFFMLGLAYVRESTSLRSGRLLNIPQIFTRSSTFTSWFP